MTGQSQSGTSASAPSSDHRALWEEAAREALRWKDRYERLHDAVEEFLLWEPGRRGFAAARRALVGVLRGEEGEFDAASCGQCQAAPGEPCARWCKEGDR